MFDHQRKMPEISTLVADGLQVAEYQGAYKVRPLANVPESC
jgi:hypothetical protein